MNKSMLTAIALFALTTTANASLENVTLVDASNGGPGGVQHAIISGSATWTWDTVTGDIVGTGPLTMTYNFGPNNVFVQDVLDLSITGAGVATATPFVNAHGIPLHQRSFRLCWPPPGCLCRLRIRSEPR